MVTLVLEHRFLLSRIGSILFPGAKRAKNILWRFGTFKSFRRGKFFKFFLWLIVGLGKFSADNGWVTTVRGGV